MNLKNDRLEQIKASHKSARPTHQNPAWLHTHRDLDYSLNHIEELESVLKVIYTWAGVDGALVPEHVRGLIEKVLRVNKEIL